MTIYTLSDFVQLVRREFCFLFSKYGYEVVSSKSVRSDEHMFLVIKSQEFSIRIQYDLGHIEISLGTFDAPAEWMKGIGNDPGWLPIEAVFEVLTDEQAMTGVESVEQSEIYETYEDRMAHISEKLERMYDEIREIALTDKLSF